MNSDSEQQTKRKQVLLLGLEIVTMKNLKKFRMAQLRMT